MPHRFYLPACTRKQVVWMAFPPQKTSYPACYRLYGVMVEEVIAVKSLS